MKNRRLRDSFYHAGSGFLQAFKSERNIKIYCAITVIVIVLSVYLNITRFEWLMILLVVGFTFVTELLNTAIEYVVDMICGNNYHKMAKYSKDVAGGASLVAAIMASIVGIYIFLPRLIPMFLTLINLIFPS